LRLYTLGSSWFSGEEEKKGSIVPGRLADLAVLSADYFSVAEPEIARIESVLTMVGGKVVYGAGEFAPLAPPLPPVSPSWSPAGTYGGYGAPRSASSRTVATSLHTPAHVHRCVGQRPLTPLWGALGCDCFAF
jgi:hypothetical protein